MQSPPAPEDMQNLGSIDTLVHLGAGRCSELGAYLALKPRRIILVEADPELAEALDARTFPHSHIQVKCVAVAGRSGLSTFHRYNLSDANSLHPATKLIDLFPGLKLVEKLQIETVKPDTLLEQLSLNAQEENYLVIDVPGEELPILRTLEGAGKLQIFDHLHMHCGRQPLYEGGEAAGQIAQWLQANGFDLVEEDIQKDPDLPSWTFKWNPLKLENSQLRQQIEELARNEEIMRRDLSDAQKTASLSVSLKALREADLKDLQSQYRESLSIQKNQHRLLVQLSERLRTASDYLHQRTFNRTTSLSNDEEKQKPGAVATPIKSRSARSPSGFDDEKA